MFISESGIINAAEHVVTHLWVYDIKPIGQNEAESIEFTEDFNTIKSQLSYLYSHGFFRLIAKENNYELCVNIKY